MLPGDSIAAKAGYLTAGTALGTALIAKEIYILNEESLVLLTTAGFLGVLLKYTREPFTNMANDHIEVRIGYKRDGDLGGVVDDEIQCKCDMIINVRQLLL